MLYYLDFTWTILIEVPVEREYAISASDGALKLSLKLQTGSAKKNSDKHVVELRPFWLP